MYFNIKTKIYDNHQTKQNYLKMYINRVYQFIVVLILILSFGCNKSKDLKEVDNEFNFLRFSQNILDYRITPKDSVDKSGLMFSDQGAWFAYSLPKTGKGTLGFSGPFLMTQQNGIWSDVMLSRLSINEGMHNDRLINFKDDLVNQNSYYLARKIRCLLNPLLKNTLEQRIK